MNGNNNCVTIIVGLICVLNNAQSALNFNNDRDSNKSFKSVPTTVKTAENDTVLLPCHHNTPFRYVRWHRDDVPLVDSRHPENPTPERIHLWLNGSLQVSNVQATDTGEYYCEIMANTGHAVQIHAIEVQYSPSIVSEPSGFLELPVGSIFEITCEAKGVPPPVITWRHNGISIENYNVGNRQNHIVEVRSREMSGPIDCLATNGVGESAVAGVHLNVLFSPEIQAVHTVVHTKINMRAHLECLVEAAPSATVHWFHHGVPVGIDSRIARHDNELESNRSLSHYYTVSKHILIIKKVKDSDLGVYECRAENKIGFKGVAIDLTGRPMPCVFKINPAVQSSTSHNMIWQTESQSPINEFKLKFRQIPSGNVTPQNRAFAIEWTELTIPSEFSEGPIHTTAYNLRGLQPASLYEVAVLARNRFGWSDNSKIVRFATGGEVELPNYSTESMQYEQEIEEDFLNEITQSSQTSNVGVTKIRQVVTYSNAIRTCTFKTILLILGIIYIL
ncbi:hemicentin-2 [Eupeodes corollae]|uniref:hemicentin-2 n=1 Tax=Eupeodes corollae TaxID=290404 RepID=UPI0024912619|nr:hemicentin-2 [Eupeodes corollae]